MQEKQIQFDRLVKFAGRSGREWQVDFQTRTADRSALICVLASGSRAAARRVSEHVLASWYDLNLLKASSQPMRFVSLFDDTLDVWGEEDFHLVESDQTSADGPGRMSSRRLSDKRRSRAATQDIPEFWTCKCKDLEIAKDFVLRTVASDLVKSTMRHARSIRKVVAEPHAASRE